MPAAGNCATAPLKLVVTAASQGATVGAKINSVRGRRSRLLAVGLGFMCLTSTLFPSFNPSLPDGSLSVALAVQHCMAQTARPSVSCLCTRFAGVQKLM